MLNRLYFPPTLPIPLTFFVAQDREQHMTSIPKSDNSGAHKIFKRKKHVKRLYFPPILPHTTRILLWRRTEEQQTTSNQERQHRTLTKYSKEKDIKSFYFPPPSPKSDNSITERQIPAIKIFKEERY
ncbi:hypothetical protein TNCV_1829361 [Trichonephila clavipes]|nr:hypothetical protein TNCV_1829361 [Trichonephila clavipes]